MSVSAITSAASQQAAAAQNDRTVLVLKKTQDAAQAQAQALIELVKASTPDHVGRNIDVYA
jgi:hypothetical protein